MAEEREQRSREGSHSSTSPVATEHLPRDADIGNRDASRHTRRPGTAEDRPWVPRTSRSHRHVRHNRPHARCRSSTPDGMSAAMTVAATRVDRLDPRRIRRSHRTLEPDPEQRVYDDRVGCECFTRQRVLYDDVLNACLHRLAATWATSPSSAEGSRGVKTRTGRPAARSSRAATQPSPPLLPVPAATATDP